MKKLSIITISLIMALCFSCSESFLEQTPQGATSENVFYNEKGINSLLIGTYAMVKGSALWEVSWGASIQNWTYGSVASDDAYKGSEVGDQIPVNEIETWNVATTNEYPSHKWKLNLGMGVFRANNLLNVIAKTEGLSEAKKTQFIAETRFLRGLFYFETWLVFGDKIPLITEDKAAEASKIKNVNAPGAVLNFIIEDLKFAWENLPNRQTDPGRPSKWAAKALAARAYLQELKYSDAKPLLDDIIANGGYTLMPNFFDNYRIAKNNNAESIFEIQAAVNDINESLNAEMGIGLNWPHGSDIGMCCGFHQPSQNLANAFRVDANGLPRFNDIYSSDLKNDQGVASADEFIPSDEPLDPRIDWTMGRRGIPYLDWGIMRGRDWIRKQPDGGPYMPALKPFFYKSERYTLSTKTGWQTGINANNYRYLRYSHVLLWRAEVAAFEGDLAKARELVNTIRDRADNELVMGKVKIYKLPPSVYPWGAEGDVDFTQPAANYKIGLYPAFADKNEAMRAVQWEIRLEFATEGMRFFDLRRWDKLPAGQRVDMKATLDAFAAADLRIRSEFMKGATFSERAKYMPIPQGQMNIQPGVLEQNDGY